MTGVSHEAMHRDHQTWQSENALWHDQIREWEQQTAKAFEDLELIRAALAQHEDALRRHAAAVRLYEQKSREHEHQIATAVAGTSPNIPWRTGGKHLEEIEEHQQVRLCHETLKRRHHELLARFTLLLASMKAES